MFRHLSGAARLAGAAAVLIILIVGLAWLVRSAPRPAETGGRMTGTATATISAAATAAANASTATPAVSTATPGPAATLDRTGGLSLSKAESRVHDYIFKNNPGMNPEATFPLVEITTDESWQRMQVQVFKVRDGVKMNDAFVIYKGQVYPIGQAFGGSGVDHLTVAELQGSGALQLLYTYEFGSGISRSSFGLFDPQPDPPVTVEANTGLTYQGKLTLSKPGDQNIVLMETRNGSNIPEEVGQLHYHGGRLFVSPDVVPMITYTSPRFGISLEYPADWQPVKAAENHVRYQQAQGNTGFFDLSPLGQGQTVQDLQRVTSWAVNTNPDRYGENPEVSCGQVEQRDVCFILGSGSPATTQSALLFLADSGEIGLLAVDSAHTAAAVQTLHFTQNRPTGTPVPVDMTPQPPNPSSRTENRALGELTLSEYAVVKASQDTPGHFEFNTRIPESVFPERHWNITDFVAENNRLLQPFGYRIETRQDGQNQAVYDVYQGSRLIQGNLSVIYPAQVYIAGNAGDAAQNDFAMLVEDASGDWLVRKASVEQWDMALHRFTRPVFNSAGNLISVEHDDSVVSPTDRLLVKQDGQVVFRYTLPLSPVLEAVRTLGAWQGGWVLEVNGTLIVNGENWNQKVIQADEIFNWTLLNGQPFFFFRRGGRIGAAYAGKELPVQYDQIMHNGCCESSVFNVVSSPTAVWFYALRDGVWYFNQIK